MIIERSGFKGMSDVGQTEYFFSDHRIFPCYVRTSRSRSMSRFVFALVLLVMINFLFTKGQAVAGIVEGKLSPCPDTPNCVCSEDTASSAYIEALHFSGSPEAAWVKLKQLVVSSGGVINKEDRTYLLSSYTSRWLRFVDDVEFRMDAENRLIHVRSASRVGHSDFGVNKKRVEMLRGLFNQTSVSQ